MCFSHSVMSDSLWPHGLQPARLLCPQNSPGRNTGVSCCALLQGIFPDPGVEPAFLMSLALAGGFFTTSPTWEAFNALTYYFIINSHCWTCPLHGVNGKHNCNWYDWEILYMLHKKNSLMNSLLCNWGFRMLYFFQKFLGFYAKRIIVFSF